MLVLTRKVNQRIFLSGGIVLTVLSMERGKVRLGFQAPENIEIVRDNVKDRSARKPVVKL